LASVQARPGTLLSLHRALRRAHKGGAVLRLGAPAVLAAVVLEAHGHVFSLIPVRAAVLAAALRDRALLGELPPIVSVRAEQNGVRKRPWPGASCGGCLNEGTRGPMGRKSGHGVVFMTHHRRQPGRSRTHERRRTALTLTRPFPEASDERSSPKQNSVRNPNVGPPDSKATFRQDWKRNRFAKAGHEREHSRSSPPLSSPHPRAQDRL
jgi:hypothetical protein